MRPGGMERLVRLSDKIAINNLFDFMFTFEIELLQQNK